MSRFAGVRAVTFDCWGTLIHETEPDASLASRVEAVRDVTGLSEEDATDLLAKAWLAHVEAWQRHVQFGCPGIVRWIAARHPMDEPSQRVLLERLEAGAGSAGIGPVPRATETLRAVKDAGLSTALVCDTGMRPGRQVRELLEAFGLAPMLDALVFSDEVGVPKPERVMFDTALGAIGGGPAVHVGDLRRTDVAGARAAGLGAVRFRGVYDDASEHPEADAVIDDLYSLTELLGLGA